jgi:hypothetical protein
MRRASRETTRVSRADPKYRYRIRKASGMALQS